MIIILEDNKLCCGCEVCYNVCPQKAIILKEDINGFVVPQINQLKCIDCKICKDACPVQKRLNGYSPINDLQLAYAFRNQYNNIVAHSTSGAASYTFAEHILKNNGVVFGVCWGNNFKVEHKAIIKLEDLHLIQGSKYVQSSINDCYKQAKEFLKNGQLVYFTGTPCQISGLKSYLKIDYSNLITQDCICHGVPSPGLWRKYLKDTYGSKLPDEIIFRKKKDEIGWEEGGNFAVRYGSRWKYEHYVQNLYFRLFMNNWLLRSSCFLCKFKTGKFESDITCADLWGINDLLPDIKDDRGMSLVLIHTNKGNDLFKEIAKDNFIRSISYEIAIKNNGMAIQSVKTREQQKEFFHDMQTMDFHKAGYKYEPEDPLLLKIKKKLYPLKRNLMLLLGKREK
ncbi:MAG: Coenzyme F420 hydrogenase/dehydrogenase, beta subunit C-terminal domain [Treponema sp.]|nr:Coenzyme F420 hydrogenase/dehydrogenase, beta subunit C-terminal domain [Treponema sp.]